MKTLVVFISHLYNKFCVDRYNDLRRSLIHNHHLVWCHTNTPPENFFKEHGVEDDIYLEIGNEFFDKRNMGNTKNNLIFLEIYKAFPDYNYYWFVEYDVLVNTLRKDPFTELFTYFSNESERDADIVADHVNSYMSNHHYEFRYPFHIISKNYPNISKLNLTKKDIHFAFYTICRLSNDLLQCYSSASDWHDLFFEWGLTTFAYVNDMKICTLLNTFTQESNKSYTPDKRYMKINNGSNSFALKSFKTFYKEYPEGYIIHPVKSYERFVVN